MTSKRSRPARSTGRAMKSGFEKPSDKGSSPRRGPNGPDGAPQRRGSSRPAGTSKRRSPSSPDSPPQRRAPSVPEETPQRRSPSSPDGNQLRPLVLFGRHPVSQMLRRMASRKFELAGTELIFLSDPGNLPPPLKAIAQSGSSLGIKLKHTTDTRTFPVGEDVNHQRVCLSLSSYPFWDWDDFRLAHLENSEEELASRRGCVGVVCDQIQDPHNLGAILRSAAFFGCSFVVIGKDRQAPMTGSALRSAAGGDASLDIVRVTNLGRCLEGLKEAGLWIVGADCNPGAVAPEAIPQDRPYVLVLGNEQKGLRKDIIAACDYRMNIPGGTEGLNSLNVSVATGVSLYALSSKVSPES